MRKMKSAFAVFAVMLAVFAMLAMSATTVYAEDETIYEETEYIEPTDAPVETEEPTQPPQEQPEVVETVPVQEETQPPEQHEQEVDSLLPTDTQAIVEATSVKIPDIQVSDTSLLGGVIAWLCVAVGIAVIVGVLVSQRTRQKTTVEQRNRKDRKR